MITTWGEFKAKVEEQIKKYPQFAEGDETPIAVLMWKGMAHHEISDVSIGAGRTLNVNILGTEWEEAV